MMQQGFKQVRINTQIRVIERFGRSNTRTGRPFSVAYIILRLCTQSPEVYCSICSLHDLPCSRRRRRRGFIDSRRFEVQ